MANPNDGARAEENPEIIAEQEREHALDAEMLQQAALPQDHVEEPDQETAGAGLDEALEKAPEEEAAPSLDPSSLKLTVSVVAEGAPAEGASTALPEPLDAPEAIAVAETQDSVQETIQEPVQEIVQEAVQEAVQETVQETAQENAKENAQDTGQEIPQAEAPTEGGGGSEQVSPTSESAPASEKPSLEISFDQEADFDSGSVDIAGIAPEPSEEQPHSGDATAETEAVEEEVIDVSQVSISALPPQSEAEDAQEVGRSEGEGASSEPASFEDHKARLLGELPSDQATAFEAALTLMLKQTLAEDVEEQSALDYGETLLRSAHSLWSFAASRRPGESLIRVLDLETSQNGGDTSTVLEVVNDDMPHLLESLTALIGAEGLEIRAVLHPMMVVERGEAGEIAACHDAPVPSAAPESWIQLHLGSIANPARREALHSAAAAVLDDVRSAHRDRETIVERLGDCAAHLRQAAPDRQQEAGWEGAAFLDWLADGHFTLLGCRDYSLTQNAESDTPVITPGRGLGLMRDPEFRVLEGAGGGGEEWTSEMAAFIAEGEPLTVLKADRRSRVRRAAAFDLICARRFDASGRVVGQTVFAGLFAAVAYTRSPSGIPLLRRKVRRVMQSAGIANSDHDTEALAHILDIHPRDELFQAGEEELRAQTLGALRLKMRPRTKLFARWDRFGRYLSCLVYVARDRFDSALRRRVAQILADATGGELSDFTLSYGSDGQVRIHYVLTFDRAEGKARAVDVASIERSIEAAARDWSDVLREALGGRFSAEKSAELLNAYAHGFPAGYREHATPEGVAADILRLEALSEDAPIGVAFSRRPHDDASALRVSLYQYGAPAVLSDALPILENIGLRILEEFPTEVARRKGASADRAGSAEKLYIHEFLTEFSPPEGFDLDERAGALEAGFLAVWAGRVEDDRLNRLMLTARLSVRQIALLRAFSRFLRQARIPYSVEYMEDALIGHPEIAETLWRLFAAQFTVAPGVDEVMRELDAERIETEIEAQLEEVHRLDVDRILRRFRNAIRATLRTNYFQIGPDGLPKSYFSFKLHSGALEELPAPRPWREIFVYSPSVEGCHLRGGPVARGGLRWSDRREDFRTEVLGLVKAQQVKNAVIVPMGSKGGFLPKKLPQDGGREAVQAEAIDAYKTFLRGMLDVTDNVVEGEIVAPTDLARRDGDDPYLVVAADKGTATFSDIANEVAAEYRFWLGDAFASGGGEGYDHKAMGITARGAWEAVKRHFRELGKDIQSEEFTVVGVGDMSGDVFGNGMLLSEKTRLFAAFDHRDIFIDPNPDAAKSYAERKRLFETPRSSWADYDPSLISQGGGVFSRSLKSVPLSAEIRALTGIDSPSATPFELIQALLCAEADLLWFGGIGTYLKAEAETHEMVGDRANDAIRVDARDFRGKVIGEGANLGVTQAARVELSSRGVKLNTDAVDNAAGVDCSDHEVNIKIALDAAMAAQKLTAAERSALLREMTADVSRLVLASNYAQTGALSMLETKAPRRVDLHRRLIRSEEAERRLDRQVEGLPSDAELAERGRSGRGLTRPELAVLTAYAKNGLQETLLASDLPDDPYLKQWLIDYFPPQMRERFREEILSHRLRREIVAILVAGVFVNDGGPALALRLREETGAAPAEATRAYLIARELFGFDKLSAEIDALDNKVSAELQSEMRVDLSRAIITQTLGVLQRGETGDIGETLARYKEGVAEVVENVHLLLSDISSDRLEEVMRSYSEAGAPETLARRLAGLGFLGGAVEVVDTSARMKRGVKDTAATYFAVGARFGLEWLRGQARAIQTGSDWDRIAIGRLISDLRAQQSAIAASALRISPEGVSGSEAVESWAMAHSSLVSRADRVFTELRLDGALSVAKLAVASSQLRGWE